MKHKLLLTLFLLNSLPLQFVNAQDAGFGLLHDLEIQIQSEIINNEVTIKWNTEREVNIRWFILERAFYGNDFSVIAMLPANNNFAHVAHYQVNDPETFLQPGDEVYYRLKTVDMNGRQQVSDLLVKNESAGIISSR